MKRLLTLVIMTALLLSSQMASGAVPQLINFQGVLKDNGQPVSNGSHSITFAIYNASSGGSPLWIETQSVTTSGGHFAVLLGSVTPLPGTVFNGSDRYLGITVPPDPELTPRQRLASVSFSYRVSTVDGASGGSIEGSLHLGAADTLFASNLSSNSPLRLQTAGVTRLYIDDATGNVGVGTSGPAASLDVHSPGLAALPLRIVNDGPGNAQLNINTFSGSLGNAVAGDVLLHNGNGNILISPNAMGHDIKFIGGTWTNPDAITIKDNGRVGIGTTAPATALDVVGEITASGNVWMNSGAQIINNLNVGGAICAGGDLFVQGVVYPFSACGQPSDRRYKTAIVPLEHVLDKLAGLRGVHFEWNEQFQTEHPQAARKQIGVIAQEVEKEFPELVSTMPDGYKAVDYGKLSSVLLEAVKEQQKEIEALRESVEKLRAERK